MRKLPSRSRGEVGEQPYERENVVVFIAREIVVCSAANLAIFPSISKIFLYLAIFKRKLYTIRFFFIASPHNSAVLHNLVILCSKIPAALVQ